MKTSTLTPSLPVTTNLRKRVYLCPELVSFLGQTSIIILLTQQPHTLDRGVGGPAKERLWKTTKILSILVCIWGKSISLHYGYSTSNSFPCGAWSYGCNVLIGISWQVLDDALRSRFRGNMYTKYYCLLEMHKLPAENHVKADCAKKTHNLLWQQPQYLQNRDVPITTFSVQYRFRYLPIPSTIYHLSFTIYQLSF